MKRWSANLYREKGRLQVSGAVLSESLKQAHRLQLAGYPAVLTLRHLAFNSGVPYKYLRELISRSHQPYRDFPIRKRSGGFRSISVPERNLLEVQRWIDRRILAVADKTPFCYAFKKGVSIVDCANQHLGCRWLVKVDVSSFFESISEIQVFHVFRAMGYNSLISFELARLCTRVRDDYTKRYNLNQWKNWSIEKNGSNVAKARYAISSYDDLRVGYLPQGAPTSPRLSNLAMAALDEELNKFAAQHGLVYTRYADDLAFSTSSDSFTRMDLRSVIAGINSTLRNHGLRPNAKKLRISPPGARKVVLGLLVDGERVRLTKTFKRSLERNLYFASKNIEGHVTARKFDSVIGFKNHLFGLLSYAHQVEPGYAERLKGLYGLPERDPITGL